MSVQSIYYTLGIFSNKSGAIMIRSFSFIMISHIEDQNFCGIEFDVFEYKA